MTNADKIRNMTDEELVEFLLSIHTEHEKDFGEVFCIKGKRIDFPYEFLEWLQQPAED